MKHLYPTVLFVILASFVKVQAQPGSSCATAVSMVLPDSLYPFGASLDSGWTWQTGGPWFTFTVPQGKEIEGFVIKDPDYTGTCSTSASAAVAVYKGTSCATKTIVDGKGVFYSDPNAGFPTCTWANVPAVFDSITPGETYYVQFTGGATQKGFRWLTRIVDSFSCSRSDTLFTSVPAGCNLTTVDLMSYPYSFAPLFNPVFYTIIPTSDTVQVTINITSILYPGIIGAAIYDSCSNNYGNPRASVSTMSVPSSQTLTITNAVVGVPLKLVIDAGGFRGGIDQWSPSLPNICTYGITDTKGILLPLQFDKFKASYNASLNNVLLTWQSPSNAGLSSFAVERSDNGTTFKYLNEIPINKEGSSNNYSYYDRSQLSTKMFYRLKMLTADGKASYSKVEVVALAHNTPVEIFPNPASSYFTISLASDVPDNADIQLLNSTGNRIMRISKAISAGQNAIPVDATLLPDGLYFVKIRTIKGESVTVKKVMISRN